MTDLTLAEAVAQLETYAADEVAELLRLAGKTGVPQEVTSCPIANYLEDVLGKSCWVDTQMTWIVADDEYDSVLLPGGVMAFIEAFDDEVYPDLITPWRDITMEEEV